MEFIQLFLLLTAFISCLNSELIKPSNKIASESVAQNLEPSWFEDYSHWHAGTDVIPTDRVPTNDPSRDMAFGSSITINLGPVASSASYDVELTFLNDGNRTQKFLVGNHTLETALVLPWAQVLTKRWSLPSDCVDEKSIKLQLQVIKGPNTIVSAFALFSSDPNAPVIHPVGPPVLPYILPRLTPKPTKVDGINLISLDLGGTWKFSPSAVMNVMDWSDIHVPGEYTLQGFRIPPGSPTTYQRHFDVPAEWLKNMYRVKLKCDGVYSNVTVWLNGYHIGTHLGGFTQFEIDITARIASNGTSNTLTMEVTGQSLADTLASGTRYAAHDLGGITRKIYVFAVPVVNIADIYARTFFTDASYRDAVLSTNLTLANDGNVDFRNINVTLSLSKNVSSPLAVKENIVFPIVHAGSSAVIACNLSVNNPMQWDPEHPHLYDFSITLWSDGVRKGQTTILRIGFRHIEVIGNELMINGRRIKARGSTRHETHPIWGRSLASVPPEGQQWRKDILAFREMNVNYIRTSHYPPAKEFLMAADELGMFVELEMPFCWATGNTGAAALNYTIQAQLETVVTYRNHPSVIVWSLGNESPWTKNFDTSFNHYVKVADSTRPFLFDGGRNTQSANLDIDTVHYPGIGYNPAPYATKKKPTLFGEYNHLNCYNRRELLTDPGVRDNWGFGIAQMWDKVYATKGVLGGCFWAGIDDQFIMPSGKLVGYGEWGLIDNWRRQKPETYIARNVYSPIKVHIPNITESWRPYLIVDNRHDFTDLSEINFNWQVGSYSGSGKATSPPHTINVRLELLNLPDAASGTLILKAIGPQNNIINMWHISLPPVKLPPKAVSSQKIPLKQLVPPTVQVLSDGSLLIKAAKTTWLVGTNGSISAETKAGKILNSGPALMVLPVNSEGGTQLTEKTVIKPFNDPCTGWHTTNLSWHIEGIFAVVQLNGSYDQASGQYQFRFNTAGNVSVLYSFHWISQTTVKPRQMGLVFTLPRELEILSWKRRGQWTTYPDEQIGRAEGINVSANAGPISVSTPSKFWGDDATPMGTNDFRETKHNIFSFSLGEVKSTQTRHFTFISNGTQHGRAWVDAIHSYLLAADLSNEGGNSFAREKVLPQPDRKSVV